MACHSGVPVSTAKSLAKPVESTIIGFRISTSIVIQDVRDIGIGGATVQLDVIFPNGSALDLPTEDRFDSGKPNCH
jgi:hypothetical protein